MGEVKFYPKLKLMEFFFQSYPSLQIDVDGIQMDGRSGRGRGGRSQRERTLVMGAATRTDVDGILFSVAAQLLSVASN